MISRKLITSSQTASKCLSLYATDWKTLGKISKLVNPNSFILSTLTNQNYLSIRHDSSVAAKPSLFSSVWEKYKQRTGRRHSKNTLRESALRLYICCVELVPHDIFIKEFDLPDTFNSWFRITELHLWMVLCRLSTEGKEGKVMRNFLIQNTWTDVDKRVKKLQASGSVSARKEGLTVLSEQFKASLFAYDEGLLGSDKELAGALWKSLFERRCSKPLHLETLVEYIHKQLSHLEQVQSDHLFTSGIINFAPLLDTPSLRLRNKQILTQIRKRT